MEFGFKSSESDDDSHESPAPSRVESAKPIAEILLNQDKPHEKHEGLLRLFDTDKETGTQSLFSRAETETSDDSEAPKPAEQTINLRQEAEEGANIDTAEVTNTAEDAATDAELSKLDAEESRQVAEDLLSDDSERLSAEKEMLAPDSPDAIGLAAAESMVDKTREKMAADESVSPEQALHEASEEVIEELGGAPQPEQTPVTNQTETTPDEDTEAADPDLGNPTTTNSGTVPAPPPSTGGSGGNTGNTPPPPPSTPNNNNTPPPPIIPPFGPPNYNQPPPPDPNNAAYVNPNNWYGGYSRRQLNEAARQGENRGLVVGGILGYLVGRRRGRIKTEKRLLPVQEKLQQEVAGLERKIANKELQVRNLAAERAKAITEVERQQLVERLQVKKPITKVTPEAARDTQPGQPPELLQAQQPEQRPETPRQVAERLIPVPVPAEANRQTPEAPQQVDHLEVVKKMTREQLMQMSEKVLIDGTSLRMIYESSQITEQGLQRLLVEYLGGKDLRQPLKKELLRKELSYERDPQIRNALSDYETNRSGGPSTNGQSDGHANNGDAVQSAANQNQANLPNIALPDGRSSSSKKKQASTTQKVVMGGWFALVVVLAFAAAILLLR